MGGENLPKADVVLLCGLPPMCDRCGEKDAKVRITLPKLACQRELCAECLAILVERGLESNRPKYGLAW